MARGTRRPSATVAAFFPGRGFLGAALERANDRRAAFRLDRDHPRAPSAWHPADLSSSSKAFHMPIMPVPPPVGYTIQSGHCQAICSASS